MEAGTTTNVDGQVQCRREPGDSRGVALMGRCVLNLNNPHPPFSIRSLKQSDGTTMGLMEEKVMETSYKDIYIKPYGRMGLQQSSGEHLFSQGEN